MKKYVLILLIFMASCAKNTPAPVVQPDGDIKIGTATIGQAPPLH